MARTVTWGLKLYRKSEVVLQIEPIYQEYKPCTLSIKYAFVWLKQEKPQPSQHF